MAPLRSPLTPIEAPNREVRLRAARLGLENAEVEIAAATSVRDGALKWFGLRQHDTGTKHPFFYMQDLIDAWLVSGHDPRAFCVVFRERDEQNSQKSGKRKEHHYEAESAHEAAEIVAKLTHVANSVLRATRTERIRET